MVSEKSSGIGNVIQGKILPTCLLHKLDNFGSKSGNPKMVFFKYAI